jgi:hypothetical protein
MGVNAAVQSLQGTGFTYNAIYSINIFVHHNSKVTNGLVKVNSEFKQFRHLGFCHLSHGFTGYCLLRMDGRHYPHYCRQILFAHLSQTRHFTMPQFLEQRFDYRVRTIMAIFLLGVYVFVNLTAILWLGALAINTIIGIDMVYGMIFLGLFSVAYSLQGWIGIM